MMYNWPPNTRAQQTLSGWCNSTLLFTYHPSRWSLFLLYGYGSRPTDSSAEFFLIGLCSEIFFDISPKIILFWHRFNFTIPFLKYVIYCLRICWTPKFVVVRNYSQKYLFYIRTGISSHGIKWGKYEMKPHTIQSCYCAVWSRMCRTVLVGVLITLVHNCFFPRLHLNLVQRCEKRLLANSLIYYS